MIAKECQPQRSTAPVQHRSPDRAADMAKATGDDDDHTVQRQCYMSGQHRRIGWYVEQARFVSARPIRAEVKELYREAQAGCDQSIGQRPGFGHELC